MKKREVLVMLISEFADWECAFLSAALKGGLADADPIQIVTYNQNTPLRQ